MRNSVKDRLITARATVARAAFAAFILCAAAPAGAQPLEFEAASVTVNKSGDLRTSIQASPGGRLRATNAPLRALIVFAYNVQPFELEGGPSWMASERFDVAATAGREAPLAEIRQMLQSLLTERFQLRVRQERREMPAYALMLLRADSRLGPALRKSAADCGDAAPAAGAVPPAPVPSTGDSPAPCGSLGPAPGVPIREAGVAMRGIPIATLARALTGMVRRPVLDRTGLTGWWDVDLGPTAELPPPPPPPGIPDAIDRGDLPSVFSVVRDRLGLKLEAVRAPVTVVVVETATRPREQP